MKALLLAAVTMAAFPMQAQDWPQFRGPWLDGTSSGNGLPAPESIGLELIWKRPLGSGYASISVAGAEAATLYSDGGSDYVTVFDARTGQNRWRHRIAEAYRGHDGSSDGPLSTPAIHDGAVFALGPQGQLLALGLEDGRRLWSRDLDAASGSRAPMYGYSTAPVVVDGLLVVQTGAAPGRSITAFDPATGDVRWSVGDDTVSYQSPAVMELLGRRQLVVVSDGFLLGLEPATGKVLWKNRHTEDGKASGASGHPLRLAAHRVLMRPNSNEAVLYELVEHDGVRLEEVWRAPLNRSHAAVLAHGAALFSYDTHYLTSLDAETGKRTWKSRPPGGRGLIRVDDYLVMLGSKGHVVIAEASSEGYREAARLKVFEDAGWTPPSFAGGHVFVRNLEEVASLRITKQAAGSARKAQEFPGRLGELVRRIESASDKADVVDAFMASQASLPVIEESGLVHFVYRGEAEDVAVAGNMTEDFGEEVAMTRLAGTDLFVRSLELDPTSHYEYRFHVDFGGPIADPKNPNAIGSIFGPSSELRMPRWPVAEHLRVRTLEGRLEKVGGERPVRVYLPPGYDESDERYPLIVFQEGEGGETAGVEQILDRLVGRSVAPVVAAFLPRLKHEHDVAALDEYAGWVTGNLLARIERDYRVMSGERHRGLLGAGSGAPISAYVAFKEPGVFGKLALQSFFLKGLFGKLGAGAFSLTPRVQDDLLSLVTSAEKQELEVHVEWSVRESMDPSSGLDARADIERLLEAFRSRGYAVAKHVVAGTPGYGSWRAQQGLILEKFFPNHRVAS